MGDATGSTIEGHVKIRNYLQVMRISRQNHLICPCYLFFIKPTVLLVKFDGEWRARLNKPILMKCMTMLSNVGNLLLSGGINTMLPFPVWYPLNSRHCTIVYTCTYCWIHVIYGSQLMHGNIISNLPGDNSIATGSMQKSLGRHSFPILWCLSHVLRMRWLCWPIRLPAYLHVNANKFVVQCLHCSDKWSS